MSAIESLARYDVAIFCPRRHDIEQQAGDADVGEVGGDRRAHHASAQHGGFAYLVRHGYDNLSIRVASP